MKSHGEFSKWLMHDDQKNLFEVLVASAMNVVFLVLIVLLLWPLGRLSLAFRLAKGYVVLWGLTCVAALLGNRIQDFFRVNLYDRSNAYVISNLAVSCFLQMGWSAFAALTVRGFVPDAPTWVVLILYLVGFLSCLIAFFAVSAFYQGHVYKLVSPPLLPGACDGRHESARHQPGERQGYRRRPAPDRLRAAKSARASVMAR